MPDVKARHIAFAVTLGILTALALAAFLVDRHLHAQRREFRVSDYEQTMDRIDGAVASISARMTFEGTTTDIQEILLAGAKSAESLAPILDEPEPEPEALPAEAQGAEVIVLTGVVWNDQRPVAFLNGEMVATGERIAGYRVAQIAKDRVILRDAAGQRRVIELYEQ